MVLATLFAGAWAGPACGDLAADDAAGWAAVGACLARDERPEAATEAWRRAFEHDPNVDGILAASATLAHQTGDDALLVDVARVAPDLTTDDVRGHLALADRRLDEVPAGTCPYPLARYRAAAEAVHRQEPKGAVLAYNEVTTGDIPGPEWLQDALDQLRDAARLGAASVYLGLEADGGHQFSLIALAGAYPDLRGYHQAFGTWKIEGGGVRLRVEREAFVPEAAVLAGEAELERWRGVYQGLAAVLDGAGESPVSRSALDPAVAADIGKVWSVAVLEGVLADIEDERRSATREPLVQALLDARAAEVAHRLDLATTAAIRARLARIEAALMVAERVREGVAGVTPVVWSTTDYGD